MPSTVLNVIVQLAVILFAISFHESAHAWMALKFGDTTAKDRGRISLNPLHHIDPFGSVLLPLLCALFHAPIFGYAKPTPVNLANTKNPRLANFWVSLAGPASNIFAGAVSLFFILLIRHSSPQAVFAVLTGRLPAGVMGPLIYVLLISVLLNLILAVFNLIPIPPMDGSGIFFSLLGRRGMRIELFFHRNALLMFLLIMALLYLGFFDLILDPVQSGILKLIVRGV